MGWTGPVVGDVVHEGWVVPLFADGAQGAGVSSGQGVLARLADGSEQWRPDAAVVGWAAGCECGWRAGPWTRVHDPALRDPAGRLLTSGGDFYDLDGPDEDLVMQDWTEHVGPWVRLEAVADAARRHSDAAVELEQAVRAACEAGASWADIGRATGTTRQSARERWSPPTR